MSFWNSVGALPTALDQASMIRLSDGRVLLAGGNTASGVVAHCYLYDPDTRTWETVESLPVAKENSLLVELDNGLVLAAGGDTANYSTPTADCVLFNPVTRTWAATGSLATARFNAAVFKLPNGKVLVAGGTITNLEGSTNTCELYDPTAGTWSSAASMASNHSMANYQMLGTSPFVVGGKDGTASASQVCESYNYLTNTWTTKTSIPVTGTFNDGFNNSVVLHNGKFLHIGGRTSGTWSGAPGTETANCAEYDPVANTWQTVGSLAQKRDEHECWLLRDGRVMVTGGFTTNDTVFLSSTEIYNPTTQTWSAGEARPHVIAATNPMGGVVLSDGRALTAGGFYAAINEVTTEAYVFDLVVGTKVSGNELQDGAIKSRHMSTDLRNRIEQISSASSGGSGSGGGKLLQLVEAHFSAATTTTSSTFVDTTTTASITPTATTSRIMISVSGTAYAATLSATQEVYFTLARNGTNIGHSATGIMSTTPAGRYFNIAFSAVDSPSSTSAVTYTVKMYTDGGRTLVFPGTGGSHGSTIILTEIGA